MTLLSFRLLLSLGLFLALNGCASVLKGTKSSVSVDIPPETEIRNFRGYDYSRSRNRSDSGTRLKLRSGRLFLLELVNGEDRDSVLLEPELNGWYLLADLYMWPIALPIDLGNDAMYDFDKDDVSFPSLHKPRVDSVVPILNIYHVRKVRNRTSGTGGGTEYQLGDFGILLSAHLGIRSTPSQPPILGNEFGIYAGYRILPPFALTFHTGVSGLLNFAPPEASIYMEGWLNDLSLDVRWYPERRVYLLAGLEHLTISADSLYQSDRSPWQIIPGASISESTFAFAVGGGFAIQGFFVEYRRDFGLKRFRIDENFSNTIRQGTFRFGVNLEL